jgi:hypothetical protein
MANHLTPEELSKELGIDRQEVIRVCIEEGVPIYQGKIDKTLFQAQLEALGVMPARHEGGAPGARAFAQLPLFGSARRMVSSAPDGTQSRLRARQVARPRAI